MISNLVRGHLWYQSKIPPLLAVAYATLGFQHIPARDGVPALGALMVSSASLAAYAHVLNDIFDAEVDRRAGKHQALATLTTGQRWLVCLLLALLGFLPWPVIGLSATGATLLALIYLLPVVYNLPPVRLKERGIWGPITDAAQAHTIPTLFVVALFTGLAPRPAVHSVLLGCTVGVWASFYGLRGGLHHQLQDRDNDLRAGIATFATENDPALVRMLLRRIVLPGEIMFLVILGLVIFTYAPTVVIALVAYGGVFHLARLLGVWNVSLDPCADCPPWKDEEVTYVPLVEFYAVWPALGLALELATREPLYGLLVALLLFLWWGAFKKQAADLWRMITGSMSKLAHALRGCAARSARRVLGTGPEDRSKHLE